VTHNYDLDAMAVSPAAPCSAPVWCHACGSYECIVGLTQKLRMEIAELRCELRGHDWRPSEYHDEGRPLDECRRCGLVNA
jgi:hypothetical protein